MSRIHPHPFAAVSKPKVVHTLKQYCVFSLIQYREALADVGWMDTESLRDVLRHLDANELAKVEDATKEGYSERDLSWYTWDFWYIQYCKAYGRPEVARKQVAVPELTGETPEDYVAPACEGQPGDWRLAYQMRAAEEADRLRVISAKLGARKREADNVKEGNGVKAVVIARLPDTKRRRTVAASPMTAGRNRSASTALFHKPKTGQPVVGIGQGWGRGPMQSMVKKPQAPGLGTKGVKIVPTNAALAKKAATSTAGLSLPSPAAGLSRSSPAGPSSSGQPEFDRPTLTSQAHPSMHPSRVTGRQAAPPPSLQKGSPAAKPSRLAPPAAPKRAVSALSGVDLAELVAAAGAKKTRK